MTLALKTFGLALAAGLFGTVGAFASTIDLTDNGTYTQGTHSATGTTSDGVDWTITPVPSSATLTYTPFDGASLANNQALNPDLAYENDGLGVYSYGVSGGCDPKGDNDEITYSCESATITFDQAVSVTGVYVLDLFGAETTLIYDASNNLVGTISAMSPAGSNKYDGYSYIEFSTGVWTTSLTFKAGPNNDSATTAGKPDFALAAITLAPVPVPAAGLLLLGGLGALGAAKRRRKLAA